MIKYIIFIYCFILVCFIGVSSFLNFGNSNNIIVQLIFIPVIIYFLVKIAKIVKTKNAEGSLDFQTIVFSAIILTILLGVGLYNIYGPKKDIVGLPTQEQSPSPAPTAEEVKKTMIEIVINDESTEINIRKKATIYSDIIAKAKEKDRYELIEEDLEWFKIKVDDSQEGYVAKKYARILENE